MKIGLIYPNEGRKEKAIHLGLGYVASFARTRHTDINFELLDTRVATRKEKQAFISGPHELVGITLMSGVFKGALVLARLVKERQPGVKVCVGGPYVSSMEMEILAFPEFDFAVYGEGEYTFS